MQINFLMYGAALESTSKQLLHACRYGTRMRPSILIQIIRIEKTAQWPDSSCAMYGSVHGVHLGMGASAGRHKTKKLF